MKLRIKRLSSHVQLPTYESEGAAAFDLAASHSMDVPPGAIALVPTGLVIEVPAGFFLGIFARSSTPLKRRLFVANGVGVLDSDYCGPQDEVKIQVYNFGDVWANIKPGDRLAQGIILPSPRVEWEEVAELAEASRGGFGSTGR